MKEPTMSHNVCSVNIRGNTYHFHLCRFSSPVRFRWFVDRPYCSVSYSSVLFESAVLCLTDIVHFVHFLGGILDHTGYLGPVDMLLDLFSDVVFNEGCSK